MTDALANVVVAGRFELGEIAGRGGMGVVYRARDRSTGRAVALKLIHTPDAETAARFVREARVLAELGHAHIVQYVAHGLHGVAGESGRPWLAMEWIDGESLATRLGRSRLRIGEAFDLAVGVASALEVAHARGVIHRDVKPQNLLLASGVPAFVKLVDFGIARRADGTAITETGAMVGTVGYMAPEQARGEKQLDPSADVFALGAVLYRALTGRPAFEGDTPLTVLLALVGGDIVRPTALRPAIPASLERVILAMLAIDRAARPPDGRAVLAALRAIEPDVRAADAIAEPASSPVPLGPGATVSLGKSAPTVSTTAVAPQRARRSRVPLAIGAVAVVAIAATTTGIVLSRRPAAAAQPSSSAAPAPTCEYDHCVSLALRDPRHAELREVIDAVTAAVAAVEIGAVPVAASTERAHDGYVDLTDADVFVHFTAPPRAGRTMRRSISARVEARRASVTVIEAPATHAKLHPLGALHCTSDLVMRRAIGAKNATGGPPTPLDGRLGVGNASGQVMWDVGMSGPEKPVVQLDDRTCAPIDDTEARAALADTLPVGLTIVITNLSDFPLDQLEVITTARSFTAATLDPGQRISFLGAGDVVSYGWTARVNGVRFTGLMPNDPRANGEVDLDVHLIGPTTHMPAYAPSRLRGPTSTCDAVRACCLAPSLFARCKGLERDAAECAPGLDALLAELAASGAAAPERCARPR